MSILLYTDAASLREEDKTLLREAGYVPIRVEDPAAVRIIDAPAVSPAEQSAILISALRGVLNSSNGCQLFGTSLARMLIAAHMAALPNARAAAD